MSTATLLRYADVVERAKQAAQGREDYVNVTYYTEEEADAEGDPDLVGSELDCRYLEPDLSPSCIVGAAFYPEIIDAGITFDSGVNTRGVGTLFQEVLWDRFHLTPRAYAFLSRLQTEQDTGRPWGEAIDTAEEATANYSDDTQAMPEGLL